MREACAHRLRASGHAVEILEDGSLTVERALRDPPDAIVTDLGLRGLSGIQVCRVLGAEPRTARVPVVLVTPKGDRRSRFWARSAGAVYHVSEDALGDLLEFLDRLTTLRAPTRAFAPPPLVERPVLERLSRALDDALCEAVIAGEVRNLATVETTHAMFDELADLVSELTSYNWMALRTGDEVLIHTCVGNGAHAEASAAIALDVSSSIQRPKLSVIEDARAAPLARESTIAEAPVFFGTEAIGQIALGLESSVEPHAKHVLGLIAHELGGALRMVGLVEARRMAATTDSLTGLLNRRAFAETIERELASADGQPMTLLMIDLDHFKQINDRHGHRTGDAALQAVADVLQASTRRGLIAARWGGEEFVVAVPRTKEEAALFAAERLRNEIEAINMKAPDGRRLCITASLGVADSSCSTSFEAVLETADRAAYLAKERGRNRVESASSLRRRSLRPVALRYPSLPPLPRIVVR